MRSVSARTGSSQRGAPSSVMASARSELQRLGTLVAPSRWSYADVGADDGGVLLGREGPALR